MPKLLNDKVLEPEFVDSDFLWKLGDTGWACKGNGYVKAKIEKIRYDSSVKLSRYLVSTTKVEFWTGLVLENLPKNGVVYSEYGYPYQQQFYGQNWD